MNNTPEPVIYTGSRIEKPKHNDACLIITKESVAYEGRFIAKVGEFLVFRPFPFGSHDAAPARPIRESDVSALVVVCPFTSSTSQSDYDRALMALASK